MKESLGRHLMTLLELWVEQGHAEDIDSTSLRPNGGIWDMKLRLAGEVRRPRLTPKRPGVNPGITDGGTTGSGIWPTWSAASGSVAAECTIASDADNEIAAKLLEQWPMAVRYVLGDTHHNTPELRAECAWHQRELARHDEAVTTARWG